MDMDTDIPIPSIKPIYHPSTTVPNSKSIQTTLQTLNLKPHPEGGYYTETDRHPSRIPNPYANRNDGDQTDDSNTRSLSSTIYYYLTPNSPTGFLHLNRGRTIHSLHRGRARYVVIHADLVDGTGTGRAPVESFVVGLDVDRGERVQWVVEGGKYKGCYLLPDSSEDGDGEGGSGGLLITETVIPGFEFEDHEFMSSQTMERLLPEEQCRALSWMLKKDVEV